VNVRQVWLRRNEVKEGKVEQSVCKESEKIETMAKDE
jgi:hypothetical protein